VETIVQIWGVIVIVCGPIAAVTVWLNQYIGLKKLRLETEKLRKELAEKSGIIAASPEEIRRYGISETYAQAMKAEWSRWNSLGERRHRLEQRSGLIAFIALIGLGVLLVGTYTVGSQSGSAGTAAKIDRQREFERELFDIEAHLRETVPLDAANTVKRHALLRQLDELERRIRSAQPPNQLLLQRIGWLKDDYSQEIGENAA
jgi:hypothetical protein